MITEDQYGVIAFLCDPQSHSGQLVKRMETHISEVFLTGNRAYKLKRAVKLPYLDFSTVQLREEACRKEFTLNQATAPNIYVGVRHITREPDGRLCFDGTGELVDAVVEMIRFGQECLFDRIAADGKLTTKIVDRLAHVVEQFHQNAPVSNSCGGFDNIAMVLGVNEAGFATSDIYGGDELRDFNHVLNDRLEAHRNLLDKRQFEGKIRRCHGDLHLRNVVLIGDEPVLFDCLEFSDTLATIDVLYDLAFLIMDLWHRSLNALANRILNRYIDHSFDDGGFVLISFFMAIRAAVRAHVIATQAENTIDDRQELIELSRSYFELAKSSLKKPRPLIIAIGGLSGTGKTTIAEALAPLVGTPPGARILESDRIRKVLFGKPPDERLDAGAYAETVSNDVYSAMCSRSTEIASAGGMVIADAVFLDANHRKAIKEVADRASVSFHGFWLETQSETLFERIRTRSPSPSDATASVLEQQLIHDPGDIGWHRIDTSKPVDQVIRNILRCAA